MAPQNSEFISLQYLFKFKGVIVNDDFAHMATPPLALTDLEKCDIRLKFLKLKQLIALLVAHVSDKQIKFTLTLLKSISYWLILLLVRP